MELSAAALEEVVARIRGSDEQRQETRGHRLNGTLLSADTPERVERRKGKLLSHPALQPIVGADNWAELTSHAVDEAPIEAQRAFERVLGGNDMLPCWFLTRGAEVRRTVGRVHIRDGHRHLG